ncbi:uncharacterized protein METZ01_LOCUS168180, partial [marine metagenome]
VAPITRRIGVKQDVAEGVHGITYTKGDGFYRPIVVGIPGFQLQAVFTWLESRQSNLQVALTIVGHRLVAPGYVRHRAVDPQLDPVSDLTGDVDSARVAQASVQQCRRTHLQNLLLITGPTTVQCELDLGAVIVGGSQFIGAREGNRSRCAIGRYSTVPCVGGHASLACSVGNVLGRAEDGLKATIYNRDEASIDRGAMFLIFHGFVPVRYYPLYCGIEYLNADLARKVIEEFAFLINQSPRNVGFAKGSKRVLCCLHMDGKSGAGQPCQRITEQIVAQDPTQARIGDCFGFHKTEAYRYVLTSGAEHESVEAAGQGHIALVEADTSGSNHADDATPGSFEKSLWNGIAHRVVENGHLTGGSVEERQAATVVDLFQVRGHHEDVLVRE